MSEEEKRLISRLPFVHWSFSCVKFREFGVTIENIRYFSACLWTQNSLPATDSLFSASRELFVDVFDYVGEISLHSLVTEAILFCSIATERDTKYSIELSIFFFFWFKRWTGSMRNSLQLILVGRFVFHCCLI